MSLLLRKWVGETLALTPALSPRRGGKHAQFPEFSCPLVWYCVMGTYVGCYDCTNALSAVPANFPTSKAHDQGASLASWSINLAGLHGVAPAQRMGIGQISSGCRYVAGLNQGAELKVNRIHIGVPMGKMSKAAVRIATAQRPVCSLLDRSADRL